MTATYFTQFPATTNGQRVVNPKGSLLYVIFDHNGTPYAVGTQDEMVSDFGVSYTSILDAAFAPHVGVYEVTVGGYRHLVEFDQLIEFTLTGNTDLLAPHPLEDYYGDAESTCSCTSATRWEPAEMCGSCEEAHAFAQRLVSGTYA